MDDESIKVLEYILSICKGSLFDWRKVEVIKETCKQYIPMICQNCGDKLDPAFNWSNKVHDKCSR